MRRYAARLAFVALTALGVGALAGCAPDVPPPTEWRVAEETTMISVFYPDGEILVEERHVVPAGEDLPHLALTRLFEASPQEERIAIVLPAATVNSVVVDAETGVCTVDFSADVLAFPGEDPQARTVAFAAIVQTLRQFPEITGLLITVEGRSSGEIGGKRIEEFWGAVRLPATPLSIVPTTGESG